jgi:hypothetical protein
MSGADERVALRNLKTAWKGATPENGDFGEAVAELNSSQMVGEGSVFERGSHVPVITWRFSNPQPPPLRRKLIRFYDIS